MYHFIVNPNSRSGKGRLLWNKIYNELKSKNVDYKIYFTEIGWNRVDMSFTNDGKTVVSIGYRTTY